MDYFLNNLFTQTKKISLVSIIPNYESLITQANNTSEKLITSVYNSIPTYIDINKLNYSNSALVFLNKDKLNAKDMHIPSLPKEVWYKTINLSPYSLLVSIINQFSFDDLLQKEKMSYQIYSSSLGNLILINIKDSIYLIEHGLNKLITYNIKGLDNKANNMFFHPIINNSFAYYDRSKIIFFQLENNKLKQYKSLYLYEIYKAAYSPNGKYLITLTNSGKTLSLYDSVSFTCLTSIFIINDKITSLAFPNNENDYFLAYSDTKNYIISLLNFNFIVETNFSGRIIKAFCNEKSIFIITDVGYIYKYNRLINCSNDNKEINIENSFYLDSSVYSMKLPDYLVDRIEVNSSISKMIVSYKNINSESKLNIFIELNHDAHKTIFNIIGNVGSGKDFYPLCMTFTNTYFPKRESLLIYWSNSCLTNMRFDMDN